MQAVVACPVRASTRTSQRFGSAYLRRPGYHIVPGPALKYWPTFRRYGAFARLAALLVPITTLLIVPAAAQESSTLAKGDAVVTGFSGTKTDADVPDDVHPLDRTFIDPAKPALRVFDLGALGGVPDGQIAAAPVKFKVTADEIGQVSPITLAPADADGPPDLYTAATSMFGLQIVKDQGGGRYQRLINGESGATWMPGQFGTEKGGGPGAIWKIDGTTGEVSLFATVAYQGKESAAPGIGGLAFDPNSKQIFASSLETGFVHRFSPDGGDQGWFDHGETGRWSHGLDAAPFDETWRADITSSSFNIENPETWGFAPPQRRVIALAVQDRRLYYSVAAGPEIWSVGLNADGSFNTDARLEIKLDGVPTGAAITEILFDGPKVLFITQRGSAVGSYDYSVFAKSQDAAVMRYHWDDGTQAWQEIPDEIAVGLKAPYRATNGGIALGYGYDQEGNIDFAQCRTTLWATGDNLRDGEDGERIDAGGARFASGLQAIAKSSGEPLNVSTSTTGTRALQGIVDYFFGGPDEAPWQTWFVDIDSELDALAPSGRIGDVAIYSPCESEPAVADVDAPEIDIDVPVIPDYPIDIPEGTPAVTISKSCAPGAIGGVIPCTISVTNTGTETSEWPVVFSDLATILAGPGAGTPAEIASAIPDGPDWLCAPTPTLAFACALPGPSLPPGITRSVDVTVDTSGLVLAGNLGFRNCATLAWPFVGQACVEGGTDLIFEKTGPAVAVAGGEATYSLTVTNDGALPFTGDVLLTDSMFVGGAAAPSPIVAFNPDPGCAGGPPAALPFSCNAPLTLAAGETLTLSITVTMPPDPGGVGYWAQNCFVATDPLFVPPPGPPPPGPPGPAGLGGAPSCVWTQVLPQNVASNLKIEKSALNAGKCQKGAGDTIECDYEIKITNEGPVHFSDTVSLEETIPNAATLTSGDPGWVCGGAAPDYICNSGGIVDLAAAASASFPVKISIPLPDLEAQGCEVKNTVAITDPPGGSQSNFKLTDDTAEANADAFMQWWVGPMLFITCDPTNIETEKIAKGPCVQSGDVWRCDYEVTLTNLGPDPLTSELKLKETFSTTPDALTFDAAWDCTGGGVDYECTHPVLNMQKGDSLTFSVSAEVKDNGQCELKNTATLIFPEAGTRGNSLESDDEATASAKTPSEKCLRPPPVEEPPILVVDPAPGCPDGRNRRSDGTCPCSRGESWDRYTGSCQPEQCYDPRRTMPNGKCCPRNTVWNTHFGACTPHCPEGSHWDRKRQSCVTRDPCPDGTRWNTHTQRCTPIIHCDRYSRWSWPQLRCIPLSCREIRKLDLPLPRRCDRDPPEQCRLGKNEVRDAKGRCVCRKGFERRRGQCVPERPLCPDGEPVPRSGKCPCGHSKQWTPKTNTCEQVGTPGACRANDDRCFCELKGGTWRNGKCITGPSPAEECKQKGGTWRNGECVTGPSPAEECKQKGGTWRNGKCITGPSPAEECKQKGGTWRNGKCITGPSPAEECKQKGGKWRRGKCITGPTPAELCKQKGGEWRKGKCTTGPTPAEECKQKGGTWRNGKCITGPSPAEECKQKGGTWRRGKCITGPTPAELCKQKGGTWRKGKCITGPSPAEECKQKGGKWRKGKCITGPTPAEQCKAKGGTWRKGKCITGSPSPGKTQTQKPKLNLQKGLKQLQNKLKKN